MNTLLESVKKFRNTMEYVTNDLAYVYQVDISELDYAIGVAESMVNVSVDKTNTPIKELISEYEAENCNFDDIDWAVKASLRYVDTMPDSQVRCLLYCLARYCEYDKNVDGEHDLLPIADEDEQ